MDAHPILLQKKYARVIVAFANITSIEIRDAFDFFYHSRIYQEMRIGIADMHCRSDLYLAEELKEEYIDFKEIMESNES